MTPTTTISSQPSPAGGFAASRHQEARPLVKLSGPTHASCRSQINRIVQEIEPPKVRAIVHTVFQHLLGLLECLQFTEDQLRHANSANETFALFEVVHEKARVLVEFIRTNGSNRDVMSDELIEILDGSAFALNHDLQRAFEIEARAHISDESARLVMGQLYRAHDILTNCLQQSTIALAMVFNRDLVGTRLFNNSDIRYRQSLQLSNDLTELIRLVDASEDKSAEFALTILEDGIENFRSQSMEYLMYSDWPQFESFCEKLVQPSTPSMELERVLHQFRCYLETLLGQVKMRAVLADAFSVQSVEDKSGPLLTTEDVSAQAPESFDLEEEPVTWGEFAYAV